MTTATIDIITNESTDPAAVELMRWYFEQAAAGPDAMARVYAPEFRNVRADRDGNHVTIDRDGMLAFFAAMAAKPGAAPAGGPARLLSADISGDEAFVVMLRDKARMDGTAGTETVAYTFVFARRADRWYLLREITIHDHLPNRRH